MIIKEFYITREDGVKLYRTYSDKNLMIQKVDTNEIYTEAVDVENAPFKYIETDQPIEENTEITDSEALAIIRGEIGAI